MAKLEIKYSSAQIKKPSVPSAEGIKIDPYYSSVAGSGFTKLGGFVDKIIKDTRVQNDKNKIRKLKINVDQKIQAEYGKYGTSSDTADVKTFLADTDFSKFKKDFRKENKYAVNWSTSVIKFLINSELFLL